MTDMQDFKYKDKTPSEVLVELATQHGMNVHDEEFHKILDDGDELSKFRERFEIPKLCSYPGVECDLTKDNDCVYFCGHSLGLQPKSTKSHIQQVLENWKQNADESRFLTSYPSAFCDNQAKKGLSELVGCYENEVVAMNSLTTNLHLLMTSFYQPTKNRYKILIEQNAFPSDYYVVASQIRLAGYDE
uniref:Kynureninase n=1 Tax=Ciona savignyi TaxID=51511 RepID=H2YA31_CIOSA